MTLPLVRGQGLRDWRRHMSLFDRIARQAKLKAERTIDRRHPARASLIEAEVQAALNQARADERDRQAKLKAERAAALVRANAAPAKPIVQTCTVVRKGPEQKLTGTPPMRREFTPSPRRIIETHVSM